MSDAQMHMKRACLNVLPPPPEYPDRQSPQHAVSRAAFALSLICMLAIGCADHVLEGRSQTWNGWLGKHKDEVMKEYGVPPRCAGIRGGEMCEWTTWGPETRDSMTLTFDKKGVVCEWQYRGFHGKRKSQTGCS